MREMFLDENVIENNGKDNIVFLSLLDSLWRLFSLLAREYEEGKHDAKHAQNEGANA